MIIEVNSSVWSEMHRHALATFPNECCGFFFGEDQGSKRVVTEVMSVANSKEGDQKRRFEINPLDYLKAEQYAIKQDLDLLGIYHSHPNQPAKPSTHDLKQAVSYFSYVIISLGPEKINETTSWQLKGEAFEPEIIEVKSELEIKN